MPSISTRPRVGPVRARDHAQARRLTRAVAAEQRRDLRRRRPESRRVPPRLSCRTVCVKSIALIMAANPLRRRRKTAAARLVRRRQSWSRPPCAGSSRNARDDVGDARVRAVGVVAARHDHVHLRCELRERRVAQRRRGYRIGFSGDRERWGGRAQRREHRRAAAASSAMPRTRPRIRGSRSRAESPP